MANNKLSTELNTIFSTTFDDKGIKAYKKAMKTLGKKETSKKLKDFDRKEEFKGLKENAKASHKIDMARVEKGNTLRRAQLRNDHSATMEMISKEERISNFLTGLQKSADRKKQKGLDKRRRAELNHFNSLEKKYRGNVDFWKKTDNQKLKIFRDGLGKQLETQDIADRKFKKSFLNIKNSMGLLSFLFIGQAITKTMTRIFTSTTDTFMKITQGQGKMAEGLTALSAYWTYLKFTIGNAIATALAPLLPYLISAVKWIADFVNSHPKFVAWALAIGLAVGMFLILGTTIALAASGLSTFLYGTTLAEAGGFIGWLKGSGKAADGLASSAGTAGKKISGLAKIKKTIGVTIGYAIAFGLLSEGTKMAWNATNLKSLINGNLLTMLGGALAGVVTAWAVGASILAGGLAGLALTIPLVLMFSIRYWERKKGKKVGTIGKALMNTIPPVRIAYEMAEHFSPNDISKKGSDDTPWVDPYKQKDDLRVNPYKQLSQPNNNMSIGFDSINEKQTLFYDTMSKASDSTIPDNVEKFDGLTGAVDTTSMAVGSMSQEIELFSTEGVENVKSSSNIIITELDKQTKKYDALTESIKKYKKAASGGIGGSSSNISDKAYANAMGG